MRSFLVTILTAVAGLYPTLASPVGAPVTPRQCSVGVDQFLTLGRRNAIPYAQFRWPNATVPYVIDKSLANRDATDLIKQAFQEYHSKTCVRFVPKTDQHKNYVKLFSGEGCYSYVGMIDQGQQLLSLGEGCIYLGTIVHELGHAVGFFHEQSRSDRDDSLTIHWNNIQQGKEDQFQNLESDQNWLINGFDVNSIMQYGATVFSKDGSSKTMDAKSGQRIPDVWEKSGLSPADVERVNTMYNCTAR